MEFNMDDNTASLLFNPTDNKIYIVYPTYTNGDRFELNVQP